MIVSHPRPARVCGMFVVFPTVRFPKKPFFGIPPVSVPHACVWLSLFHAHHSRHRDLRLAAGHTNHLMFGFRGGI